MLSKWWRRPAKVPPPCYEKLHPQPACWSFDEGDILAAARHLQGLERLDQIKYAVLERNGGITIIPQPGSGRR